MKEFKELDERKNEIMDCAMRLFAEKGYENITMENIAEELKMNVGFCYQYFESKERLYDEVLSTYVDICSEDIIEIFKSNPEVEECIRMLKSIVSIVKAKLKYSDVFNKNEQFHLQLENKMIEKISPYVVKYLNAQKENGKIQIDNPVVTAKFIQHCVISIFKYEDLACGMQYIQNKVLRELYRKDVQ